MRRRRTPKSTERNSTGENFRRKSSADRVRELSPGAKVPGERFLGMTKSLIAVGLCGLAAAR